MAIFDLNTYLSLWRPNSPISDGNLIVFRYIRDMDISKKIKFKYFELWFGPNKLLLLVDRIIIFGIRISHESEVCDESQLSQSLKDTVIDYIRNLNDKNSETSLTSPSSRGGN